METKDIKNEIPESENENIPMEEVRKILFKKGANEDQIAKCLVLCCLKYGWKFWGDHLGYAITVFDSKEIIKS